MSQTSSNLDIDQNMRQSHLKLCSNRSQLVQLNQIPLHSEQHQNFKISTIKQNTIRGLIFKELARFLIYILFAIIILSVVFKNPSATIYSIISKSPSQKNSLSNKQVPGLFPQLSSNWEQLLFKWDIVLVNGKNGAQNYRQSQYQLEFKHFDKKEDVVYVTKGGCKGHLILNWQVYGNNIYLTNFVPPKDSMIIPNEPQDEQCIKQKSEIINLLKYSTIWTINQQNSKTSLFLLVQQIDNQNKSHNSVLIADKHIQI